MIRDAKATGLANLPFDDIVVNRVWMHLCFANDLLAWAQSIGCIGQLRHTQDDPTPAPPDRAAA